MNVVEIDFIIPLDDHLDPTLPKVLDQVVGEGIKVVNDKDHTSSVSRRVAQKSNVLSIGARFLDWSRLLRWLRAIIKMQVMSTAAIHRIGNVRGLA